jgi:hypothetical protein
MTRLWPSLLGAARVVQPETILRWHRASFTVFWRWKSRKGAGRPKIDRELRELIRRTMKLYHRQVYEFAYHRAKLGFLRDGTLDEKRAFSESSTARV